MDKSERPSSTVNSGTTTDHAGGSEASIQLGDALVLTGGQQLDDFGNDSAAIVEFGLRTVHGRNPST